MRRGRKVDVHQTNENHSFFRWINSWNIFSLKSSIKHWCTKEGKTWGLRKAPAIHFWLILLWHYGRNYTAVSKICWSFFLIEKVLIWLFSIAITIILWSTGFTHEERLAIKRDIASNIVSAIQTLLYVRIFCGFFYWIDFVIKVLLGLFLILFTWGFISVK